ncbi:hypothetical protein CEXT_320821 [Caerostris extrusa]|uniref:Uncharacterized protein n=1 Tax=Caerostris extrusa TaxID=172846 RepID=A0AAV4VZ41_CAEEX|nr:hypothetical protein CEXT_320821 [Caerostris extrusa]
MAGNGTQLDVLKESHVLTSENHNCPDDHNNDHFCVYKNNYILDASDLIVSTGIAVSRHGELCTDNYMKIGCQQGNLGLALH